MGLTSGNSEANSATVIFNKTFQNKAEHYLRLMYSEELAITDILKLLSRFKFSSDPREKSIFVCIIILLLDRYKKLPSYQEKEVGVTAILFGSVIKNQLVTHIPLAIAMRCVLETLNEPADSKMFGFGIKALEQCTNRLDEWPLYCNHILEIRSLKHNHPELVKYIQGLGTKRSDGGSSLCVDHLGASISVGTVNENAISAPTPFSLPPGLSRLSLGIISTGFHFPLNINTLLSAAGRRQPPIEAPAPEVQYEVSLIIDNLYCLNIEAKAREFSEVLTEQYFPWFAQYLVVKRASIESNCTELYLNFLEKVNSRALNNAVLKATYENCKVLLASELIKSSSEERSILKKLSCWLGKLTIGRNRFLSFKEIDPQSLILEAYEKGLMIAVIPFTSKTCRNSLAYKPPNPWTMAILALLAEIYAIPDLKMSLKYEIEVVFGSLDIKVQQVAPTSLLKDRVRACKDNPDFLNKDMVPITFKC